MCSAGGLNGSGALAAAGLKGTRAGACFAAGGGGAGMYCTAQLVIGRCKTPTPIQYMTICGTGQTIVSRQPAAQPLNGCFGMVLDPSFAPTSFLKDSELLGDGFADSNTLRSHPLVLSHPCQTRVQNFHLNVIERLPRRCC